MNVLHPGLLLALLLSVGYASVYHLWGGRDLRDLGICLLAAMVGFGLGHSASVLLGLDVWRIGQVRVIEGTVGAWLALTLVYLLQRKQKIVD